MILPLVLLAAGLGAAPNQTVLDDFSYRDARAAAQAWIADERTAPVRVAEDPRGRVVEIAAPFGKDRTLPRAVADRKLAVDLAAPGEFTLDASASDPGAIQNISLYFHSGDGWYAGSASLVKPGWQTLRFSKASFTVEGRPAGWHKIDGVRIAAWRGADRDTALRLARLAASWHPVAVVVPAAADRNGESRSARSSATTITTWLEELGLGADAVEEPSLAQGALAGRRVAILAYNPTIGAEAVAALEQFVGRGGKLLVCYQLPARLEATLGFGRTRYVRPERPTQLAEVRFDAAIPGLPKAVRQASWNITVAEPIGQGAKVIGRWFDAEGKATGHAAMLLSDRGAFFSHIFLPDDHEGKKQLLAALLGHLDPPLWPEMVRGELENTTRIGHFDSIPALAKFVEAGQNNTAKTRMKAAQERLNAAKAESDAKKYSEAVEQARKARELLAEAYLRATPSRVPEGRAFWEHSGAGAYPGDWDRTAKELAAGGFNMIIPNMLWGGLAHYASDVLPRSGVFTQHGDQIAQCVAAAHKHGLEVHVWKVNYNLQGAPRDFVTRMRDARRTQVSASGEPSDWLCPSHPDNFKLELESMLEVARKYDVDGLHFDYIRYPDGEHCYCDGCRERFEAASGVKVAHWPADCHRGPRAKEYRDWRCQQITRLVEAVHREAKRIKPGIRISAAVFGSYPSCRESVGQDWVAWVKAGYLDFVCPMDYTESDLAFSTLVANQLKLVDGRIPIYPGIGATASNSGLSPDRVVGQIHHARGLGAAGFTVFNLDRRTIGSIVPAVGLGASAEPAKPPHRKP
jgi:uncharacterized lipoprotein YddW (UPF0748 family)